MPKLVPFPQADDFDKIVLIVNIPVERQLSNLHFLLQYLPEITTQRQIDYYLSAARYLNLIDDDRKFTDTGLHIRELERDDQTSEFIKLILSDKLFLDIYTRSLTEGRVLTAREIEPYVAERFPEYVQATHYRRSLTVSSWINWIFDHSKI